MLSQFKLTALVRAIGVRALGGKPSQTWGAARRPSSYQAAAWPRFWSSANPSDNQTNFVIDLMRSDISRDAASHEVAWVIEDERVSKVAIIKGGDLILTK